ncbi:DegT/DnrJ/EryC1/StrS family aminotransferase [Agrobacterium pusense]|uniref:DegT/DnrJ/EryC1/StrS family aminotransferase n=1 Tax=Agrobacterium pusense TaxID=648995 RepID=UPI002FE2CA8F
MSIPVYRPDLTELETRYVNECMSSTWISSKGAFIDRFEEAFETHTGIEHAISVSNGTVALHLCMVALGIGPGDEVIVPSLTYIASVNCILQVGATPVYVDSDLATWQMDVSDVEKQISPRTKAIMAVHLYGLPCDMEKISSICHRYNLRLIEDCAEAFGTYFRGRHVGTFGDVATFSFFGNKTITTGEGGMVTTSSSELAEKIFHLKNQGVSKNREYWHDGVAYNYRMTNLAAAIGLAQIQRSADILQRKRQLALFYENKLRDLPLTFHAEVDDTIHSFWMCSIMVDALATRENLRNFLRERGIETRPAFFPAHTLPHTYQAVMLPNSKEISERALNLPSFPTITPNERARVVDSIRDFFCGTL